MRSRRRNLILVGLASAIVLGRWAYPAEPGRSGFAESPAIRELVPAEADGWAMTVPALPAELAICHEPGVPAWYFQMEGLALKRDVSGNRTFQVLVTREWNEELVEVPDPMDPSQTIFELQWVPTDTVFPVLGTQDLHFGYQGGGRALVGRTLGNCHAFEVSFFDLTDWSELAAVRNATEFVQEVDGDGNPTLTFPASLFSPFSNFGDPPIEGLDYNHLASISYTASLDNLEWNLRRWILADPQRLQASVLVGGRYMNLGESLFYYTESAAPGPGGATNAVTTDTDNSLLGVQVGAMFEFHVDPGWWINCEIKGAFFDNAASQTTTYVHDGVAAYQGTHVWRRDDHISSYALDLRLTATVLVTPRLTVRGGYQALWLDGLALASDNMSQDINFLVGGPAQLVENGKAVYHGPHLGVSWVW